MKILLINDSSAPVYGAELQTLALRDGLRRRGHEVLLLSSRVTPSAAIAPQADVTCFGSASRLQALTQAANPSAYLALRRVLRRFRPDVVHVSMFLWQLSPLILPLLRRVPCLYQALVYKSVCPIGTKLLPDGTPCRVRYGRACLSHRCVGVPRWLGSMAQLALLERWRSVFDRVIVPSTAMRDLLQAEGIDGIRVVPTGFVAPAMRPPLSDPPLIAFAGRMVPEKGLSVLLQAFAAMRPAVPAARLLIAGDGPHADSLQQFAASLGIADAVEWLGYVPREQLEHRFAAAWVQVVPSLWQEPFGNVTAEAMLRGTAVVASRVGGASDIIADGSSGLLVPPGDVGALAQALTGVVQDRARAEHLGASARRAASSSLGEERFLDTILGIYGEIVV